MKTNGFETDFLKLYFTNVDIANIGDATGLRGSSTAGDLYLSLHTAYPGEGGDQSTSECAYTDYERKAIARSTAEWTVTGNTCTTDNDNDFVEASGGSEVAWFVGCGRQSSGANELDYIAPMGSIMGEGTAATSDTFTLPGHGLSVDDRVAFFALPSVALPTGVTAGTVYWVKTAATDTFTISTTQGGGTLDVTASGSFLAFKMVGITITTGVTPHISAGAITFKEE